MPSNRAAAQKEIRNAVEFFAQQIARNALYIWTELHRSHPLILALCHGAGEHTLILLGYVAFSYPANHLCAFNNIIVSIYCEVKFV